MSSSHFDFVLSEQLKAIENDFQLSVAPRNRTLLLTCWKRTPKFVAFSLTLGVWIMEYLPLCMHLRPFSRLSPEKQGQCLRTFRNLNLVGLASVIQILQTNVILAAYEGLGET